MNASADEQGSWSELLRIYRATLDAVAEGVLLVDLEGRVIVFNNRLCELLGISPKMMDEASYQERIKLVRDQFKDPVIFASRVRELMDDPTMIAMDELETKDGLILERYSRPLTLGPGRAGRVWSFREVTGTKEIENELRDSRERFRDLVESTSDWVWEVDTTLHYTYASPRIKELYGFEPEDVIGKSPLEFMPPKEAAEVGEYLMPLVQQRQPFAGIIAKRIMADGNLRQAETSGVPFYRAGEFAGYRGITRDVTERKAAEERVAQLAEERRLLLEVAEVITGTLELSEIMERLVNIAVKLTQAGRCTVLLAGDGPLMTIAASTDRDLVETGALEGDVHSLPDKPKVVSAIQAKPHPLMLPVPPADMESALVIPLRTANKCQGAILLDEPGRSVELSSEQWRVAESIGRQASVAIQNARTFKTQQTIATTLQESLRPDPLDIEGVDVGFKYQSASEDTLVGGDFYDIYPLADGRLVFIVGDVSGKGLEAAMDTGMVKYATRSLVLVDPSPTVLLGSLNATLCSQLNKGRFVTMFYGILNLDTGEVECASAGHMPPLLCSSQEGCAVSEAWIPGGLALGVLEDTRYESITHELHSGDAIVLYTDGVTEARSIKDGQNGPMFGPDRLIDSFCGDRWGQSAQDAVDSLYDDVVGFSDGHLFDDIAIMSVKLQA